MLNIPLKFADLLKVIDTLSPEQKLLLRQHIDTAIPGDLDLRKPRVLGLHRDAIWTSDDFDEPLPDEFWLGEDT